MTEEEMEAKCNEGMAIYEQDNPEDAGHDILVDLAKNGHVRSHYELAKIYLNIILDTERGAHSYMHVRFAIAGGWNDAEGIKDELEERLDDYHKEKSNRLLAEWIASNPAQPYHEQATA